MKTKKERVQVGIDGGLKEEAENILRELGMNPTTAITILYKQVVARGEFPLEIKLSEEKWQAMRLREITKNINPERLDTDEKLEAWLNEEQ